MNRNERDLASMFEQQSSIEAQEYNRSVTGMAFGILMRKVYLWMALALAITAGAAYLTYTQGYVFALMDSKVLLWGLIIAELGLVIGLSAAINKLSLTTATIMFILYSLINGVTLSFIFLWYETPIIGRVFLITAVTFGAMGLIGYTTKKDLSAIGKFLFMALIGLIITTIINFFVGSEKLDLIISYIGVLIFAGLTAYDTQKIKEMCNSFDYADASAQKLALLGALSLYLDFINLFLYLLRIFGRK